MDQSDKSMKGNCCNVKKTIANHRKALTTSRRRVFILQDVWHKRFWRWLNA